MVMKPISVEKAKEIAGKKRLKPAVVSGTNVIQFTKKGGPGLEIITWEKFEGVLKRRKVRIYESGGWMKIMK